MSLLSALALATGLAGLALGGRTLVVGPGGAYPDLAAALEAARDGDTVEVRGGVHPGPVVVERAVALVGVGWPVIDGGGRGTVVTFRRPGGALAGFLVRGSGDRNDKEDAGVIAHGQVRLEGNRFEDVLYGIDIKQGPESLVAGNAIRGRDLDIARKGDAIRLWESHDSVVADNTVESARDLVIWYSKGVTVRGNTVRDSRYGLHFMYSAGSTVRDNRFERNAVGAYAMYSDDLRYEGNVFSGNHGPSGYGLALKEASAIAVRANVFAGNRTGLYLDNSPLDPARPNPIAGNLLAYNDIGLALTPSVRGNVFARNNFVENFQQVALTAGGELRDNDWTPGGAGNFWSNYAGYDADGDGLGDLPYQELSLFNDLATRYPELRLFSLSPAQSALDLAARAFPVFRPPPVLTDTAPRTVPLPLPAPLSPAPTGRLALASLALLGLAGLALAWAGRLDPPVWLLRSGPALPGEVEAR